jgi:hypothetical protein
MWLVFYLATNAKNGYSYKLFPFEQNIKGGCSLDFILDRKKGSLLSTSNWPKTLLKMLEEKKMLIV